MKTLTDTDADFICDINAPCFHMLVGKEVEMIRESKTQVLFRKGETIIKQGTYSSYILFIISGLAKQYLEDGEKNFNLRIQKPGDFVGLSTIFENNTFNYSTMAITDTQALIVEKNTIEQIILNNSNFAFSLIKRYGSQNSKLFGNIHNLMFKQMNGRMADTLIYLSSDEFSDSNIFSFLSRRDIADFTGISTESAVKLLKNFEKDRIIKIEEKNIKILKRSLLEEISRKG